MNLVWLKYVSYALVACAALLYFAIRLNKTALTQSAKAVLFVVCIALSCILWHVQERNAQLYSPRNLLIGTVASVSVHTQRHGAITDTFTLQLPNGGVSQPFTTTDTVARNASGQPIHAGDTLGVLYRTWDDVPLSIDELQGQRPGWHYERFTGALSVFIWTVAITAAFALTGAFGAARRQSSRAAQSQTSLDPNA